MLHILLAAAISTAAAKPLFVPPASMKRVAEDASIREEIARSPGASFVVEYRGVAKVKPDWSPFKYDVPEAIAIVRHSTKANAAEWGMRTLTGLGTWHPSPAAVTYCAVHKCTLKGPDLKKVAGAPIQICNGQRGWMNVFERDGEVYQQVFARSGDEMYVALLHYAKGTGDVLSAARSLRTLCPEHAGELPPVAQSVPFKPPAGWIPGAYPAQFASPEFKPLAYWTFVAPSSMVMQSMLVAQAADASEYITPQQEAEDHAESIKSVEKNVRVAASREMKLCNGADGWFMQLTATDKRKTAYTEELVYGYGNDLSYVVRYVRAANEPENPAAHKALLSLCPPQ